ncbi:MAG: hypothetical protein ABS89_02105 [Thiobacillus sp. SCN 63-1177]|nr:MAG: hypothetical protein ABS89_02105 [Thiobacillus sp. SCN 63-1177]
MMRLLIIALVYKGLSVTHLATPAPQSLAWAWTDMLFRAGSAFPILQGIHRLMRRNRSALVITDTELKLMAAAAIMGESNNPKTGYSTPAECLA